MMSKKNFLAGLIVIGLMALIMRVFVGQVLKPVSPIHPDSGIYLRLATHLLESGVYSITESGPPQPSSLRMPLYPFFLAAIRVVSGPDGWHTWILGVQYVLGSLFCGLVALLGAMVMDRRTGLLAGGMAAFYQGFVFVSIVILRETLSLVMLLSLFIAFIQFVRKDSFRWGSITACLFGLSFLNRPETVSVGFVLVALYFSDLKRILKSHGGKAAVLVLLAVGPWAMWAARNASVHGHFLPFSSDGAWGFYMGQVYPPEQAWDVADPKAMEIIAQTPAEYDWYRRMNKEGMEAALANPLRNATWGLIKIGDTFQSFESPGLGFFYPLLWVALAMCAFRRYRYPWLGLVVGVALAGVHLALGSWNPAGPMFFLRITFSDIIIPGAIGFAWLILRPKNGDWKVMAASFTTLIISVVAVVAHYRMRVVFCDWILILGTAHIVWMAADYLCTLGEKHERLA